MSNKIKFAIVGCGHIGKRHASIISNNEYDAQLVALCDIRAKKDIFEVGVYDGIPFFLSIDELVKSNLSIDVIVVATPNGFHEEHSLKILNSGFHVVIEKPMALTKIGCERIIHLALQKNRTVFCVMQNRYSPPSKWLKDIILKGILGKIYLVQINCYWNRDNRYYKPDILTLKPTGWHGTKKMDGGTLFTQFSHFIDLMYWYFGDITNIKSRFNDFNHHSSTEFEDSGVVSFEFLNGGIGTLNFSTSVWESNLESSITIIAENGSIKIGGQYMNEVEYCKIKDYSMPELEPSNPPNNYGGYTGSAMNHHYVIENVVDVLRDKSIITTNALEGLKVVDIIERIYMSI